MAQLQLSEFLEPTTSYLSVVELGLYESTVRLNACAGGEEDRAGQSGMGAGDRAGAGAAAQGHAAAPLAGDPAAAVLLLLSDGQEARRDQELV